ncbi:MAG: ferrochelatase [Herminiimonas sp.]|nr:ferrochelatase [Herminiimonas sp.]
MRFVTEPEHHHGAQPGTAVLFVNLGTPAAPTAAALRPYLKEFLWDPRVVEIPRALWWLILHGIILPFRSPSSAKKYAAIWTNDGSPLKVHTERQAAMLRGYLGQRGHRVHVAYAMRYGGPSVAQALQDIKAAGCDRVLVVPAYPQYSGTTTASIWDAVFDYCKGTRNVPELRLLKHYHDHDAYLSALEKSVRGHWTSHGRGEKLVMSFHGVPKRTLLLGDPYYCECQKTARLLASRLGLRQDQYLVSFQSRFGKAEWLQPYTAPTLVALARQGVQRVDVMCPGFTSDCLETLEEINMEVRQDFLTAGGKEFHYLPCLNESPDWINALADIVEGQLAGWSTRPAASEAVEAELAAKAGRLHALELGAED